MIPCLAERESMDPITIAKFEYLTGHKPLRWQIRLYSLILAGHYPDICSIPTGLGKTSIIVLWILALTAQARSGSVDYRRLVWIINRRNVIDQATAVALEVLRKVEADDYFAPLGLLASFPGERLAVSSIRGGKAENWKNWKWKDDPARPAILIATVDKFGSRLLFSGYGDSHKTKPLHAALLSQDVLVVVDESHLEQPFIKTLHTVINDRMNASERKTIRLMEVTATPRSNKENVFSLSDEDMLDEFVCRRANAVKIVAFHKQSEKCSPAKQIAMLAVDRAKSAPESENKIVVYVTGPDLAQSITKELRRIIRDDHRVAILTGIMRGRERDELVKSNPVYKAFMDKSRLSKPIFLVCTSAGEVGIDLYADHSVMDSTTLLSLLQRLGRIGRDGLIPRSFVDVVVTAEDPKTAFGGACLSTRTFVEGLPDMNASPANVSRRLAEGSWASAMMPESRTPYLTSDKIEKLAMSSFKRGKLPGAPCLYPFLHGIEKVPPETAVAWRNGISEISSLSADALADWLEADKLAPPETLEIETSKLRSAITKSATSVNAILIPDGEEPRTVKVCPSMPFDDLEDATLILPTSAGMLDSDGMLSSDSTSAARPANDDAVKTYFIEIDDSGMSFYWSAGSPTKTVLNACGEEAALEALSSLVGRKIVLAEDIAGDTKTILCVMKDEPNPFDDDCPTQSVTQMTLARHTEKVVAAASDICKALHIPADLESVILRAAAWHDSGKDRHRWQSSIHNDSGIPMGKSGARGMNVSALHGYRHELGSLIDCSTGANPMERHLVAVHHGHGRPHFEAKAFDDESSVEDNVNAVVSQMQNYDDLARSSGHWHLAWIESILRCADAHGSRGE